MAKKWFSAWLFRRFEEWKGELFTHKEAIVVSVLFLVIALLLNRIAGSYVDRSATFAVGDLFLDMLPVVNLSAIYWYGYSAVVAVFFLYPLFFCVKKIHIAVGQFSLLVLIRSFFIALTHLRVPSEFVALPPSAFFGLFSFKNDLFFSGHVAVSALGFLLFRKEGKLRWFFIIAVVIMALTVLLMHAHYSIDVFAALFIAYGTFKIGEWFFRKINHY